MSSSAWLRAGLGIAALSAALVAPGTALAESDQFASPSGKETGDCRVRATPCSLTHAVDRASTRDTVVVLPGHYTVAAGLWPQQSVNFEGAAGSMPVIDFGSFTMGQVKAAHPDANGALDVYGSNIRNLKFVGHSDDSSILNFDDATAGTLDNSSIRGYIDRVVIEGTGTGIPLVIMGGLRNSIVTAADSAYAVDGVGSVIGSTIVNQMSNSSAIRVRQTRDPSGLEQLHSSLYVRNSIVRGRGGEPNILTLGPAVNVDWTNVDAAGSIATSLPPISAEISLGGHINTSDPGFVSATDLSLQANSPLVDAGATAQTLGLASLSEVTAKDLGALDALGARRVRVAIGQGASGLPDIGGVEFQPAAPVISAVRTAASKARAGRTNSVSFRASTAANIQVGLQRLQGKKASLVSSRRGKVAAGGSVFKFVLKVGRKNLAKGQYRFVITPSSFDGVAGKAVYVQFKVV